MRYCQQCLLPHPQSVSFMTEGSDSRSTCRTSKTFGAKIQDSRGASGTSCYDQSDSRSALTLPKPSSTPECEVHEAYSCSTIQQIRPERQALGTASKQIDVRHHHCAYDPVIAQAESSENQPFALMFSPARTNLDVFTTRMIPLSTAQNRRPASGLRSVGAP